MEFSAEGASGRKGRVSPGTVGECCGVGLGLESSHDRQSGPGLPTEAAPQECKGAMQSMHRELSGSLTPPAPRGYRPLILRTRGKGDG